MATSEKRRLEGKEDKRKKVEGLLKQGRRALATWLGLVRRGKKSIGQGHGIFIKSGVCTVTHAKEMKRYAT